MRRGCKRYIPPATVPPSLRSLAAECGVSIATVSRALAGHASVREEQRSRIVALAQRQGYARNPLVGSLMAHVRVKRAQAFVGNLALIHVPTPGQSEPGPQQRRIIRGAQARASALGYQLYEMSLGATGMRAEVVLRVLRARGVSGLIFLHSQPLTEPLEFPWNEFVAIELDFGATEPALHTVCHDHYQSLTNALLRLRAAGYQRAGIFLERFKDERTQYRWSAAFRSFQERRGGIGEVPVLEVETMNERTFAAWYRAHRPDLVIGHFADCIGWLRKLRRRVPEDVGFFSLNRIGAPEPCAGIDPRLELQGEVALETLVGQLHHGERGLPVVRRTVLVPGEIVAGPTARLEAPVGTPPFRTSP